MARLYQPGDIISKHYRLLNIIQKPSIRNSYKLAKLSNPKTILVVRQACYDDKSKIISILLREDFRVKLPFMKYNITAWCLLGFFLIILFAIPSQIIVEDVLDDAIFILVLSSFVVINIWILKDLVLYIPFALIDAFLDFDNDSIEHFWLVECKGRVVAYVEISGSFGYSFIKGVSHFQSLVILKGSETLAIWVLLRTILQSFDFYFLKNIVVVPDWRKKGLGSAIMKCIIQEYPNPIYLSCTNNLVSFFTRLGFGTSDSNLSKLRKGSRNFKNLVYDKSQTLCKTPKNSN